MTKAKVLKDGEDMTAMGLKEAALIPYPSVSVLKVRDSTSFVIAGCNHYTYGICHRDSEGTRGEGDISLSVVML